MYKETLSHVAWTLMCFKVWKNQGALGGWVGGWAGRLQGDGTGLRAQVNDTSNTDRGVGMRDEEMV